MLSPLVRGIYEKAAAVDLDSDHARYIAEKTGADVAANKEYAIKALAADDAERAQAGL